MKKEYKKPELNIQEISLEDIVTTSAIRDFGSTDSDKAFEWGDLDF